jgi:ribosomal protein S27AE
MKRCFQCRLYLPDETKFCPRCGRTFNVKYCLPKLHLNALGAHFCSVCGSSEMTAHDERPRPAGSRLLATAVIAGLGSGGFVLLAVAHQGALPPLPILAAVGLGAVVLTVRSDRRR